MSYFLEDVGELLFGMDVDAGSITERLAAAGVDYAEFAQEIDAIAADEVDALHLGLAEGAPLLRQHSTSLDRSGRILEYADDRYHPGLVTFTTRDAHPGSAKAVPASVEPAGPLWAKLYLNAHDTLCINGDGLRFARRRGSAARPSAVSA